MGFPGRPRGVAGPFAFPAAAAGLPADPIADHQGEQRLGILDSTVFGHSHGIVPGDDDGLELLVGLMLDRAWMEILAEVQIHPLVHHTRAHEPFADPTDTARPIAGLI